MPENSVKIAFEAHLSVFQLITVVIACLTKAETQEDMLQCVKWCFELIEDGGFKTMAGRPWSQEEQKLLKENKDLPARVISLMLANNGYYRNLDSIRSYRYKISPLWGRKPHKQNQRSFVQTTGDVEPIEFTSETSSPCRTCGKVDNDKNERECRECSKRASFALSNHRPEWVGYGSAVWEAMEMQQALLNIPGYENAPY